MKKDINGRQVVREALRITTLVQMGAYREVRPLSR